MINKNAVIMLLAVLLIVGGLWPSSDRLEAQPVFDAGRVTVTTAATAIYTTAQRGATVRICNRHTTPIFIGPAGVTTANGFEVLNATCENITPYPGAVVYGIVAAATARVDYFVHEQPR